jgi:hypothetical protein
MYDVFSLPLIRFPEGFVWGSEFIATYWRHFTH